MSFVHKATPSYFSSYMSFVQSELIQFTLHIVNKPDPGIDPVKELGPGFYGSTCVNSGQPGKFKKNKF